LIRFVAEFARESFRLGIHRQPGAAKCHLRFVKVHVVERQVLGSSLECIKQILLRAGQLRNFFGRGRASKPVGNVSHMTQCGRKIALENISVKVADLPAAHCLNEILMVTAAAGYFELPDFLIVVVVGPAAREVAALAFDYRIGTGSAIS